MVKPTLAWLFGTFKKGTFDDVSKDSTVWHVKYNHYRTWCGLSIDKVKTRKWVEGPPSGPVCTPCGRYFASYTGMTPERASRVVADDAKQ